MDFNAVSTLLPAADALIVVPPFCEVQAASLGAHVLQACARRAGFTIRVLYANMLFSRMAGYRSQELRPLASVDLLGERLFARAAYGVSPLGGSGPDSLLRQTVSDAVIHDLLDLESRAAAWASELGQLLAALRRFRIIGFTTTFQQTAASVALSNALKHADPQVVTIIGGANCDGDMASGIARLAPSIDYVFSGESELTFPAFLLRVSQQQRPAERIIVGKPCDDLSTIPLPVYDEYVTQKRAWLSDACFSDKEVWLPYESSRGCWWGERHHCTFCGLNALGMAHREKPADLVLQDLQELLDRYPFRRIMMTDNIMPHSFFKTLIPRLAETPLDCDAIFYEQKANLSLDRMVALHRAGVKVIQPGVEALSTDLLRLMDKGVTARQNVAMLRYARSVGVSLIWNLLYDFPDDRLTWYEQTLALLPLVRHLHPPQGMLKLSIDRFSPYFDRPMQYGLTRLVPLPEYGEFLPPGFDSSSVAYYFIAEYQNEWRERRGATCVRPLLEREIDRWRERWARPKPPMLSLSRSESGQYLLVDTRGLNDRPPAQVLEPEHVTRLMRTRVLDDAEDTRRAIADTLAVSLDGYYVPLVTADPELLVALDRGEASEVDGADAAAPPST